MESYNYYSNAQITRNDARLISELSPVLNGANVIGESLISKRLFTHSGVHNFLRFRACH